MALKKNSHQPQNLLQMSLHSKLGPQGRALLRQGADARDPKTLVVGPEMNVYNSNDAGPQELDFLIDSLRNAKDLSVNKVLGYMYHYLPMIKVEHNLRMVFTSFLHNSTCFANPNFEENYQIVEVFKLLTDKKLSISQPTLPVKNWYEILAQEVANFVRFSPQANSWKVLPVLSGMLLSNGLRDDLYSKRNFIEFGWFFNNWDKRAHSMFVDGLSNSLAGFNSPDVINLSILCLALIFNKETQTVGEYTPRILSAFMIKCLMQLMFSNAPYTLQSYEFLFTGGSVSNKPVIKHMNRLSFLLEAYLKELKVTDVNHELIFNSLNNMKLFNITLATKTQSSVFNDVDSSRRQDATHQEFWVLMKNVFFSECIIVQGVLTRFMELTSKSFSLFSIFNDSLVIERQYRQICLKIIECFYHLNHVLLSIGQGGFDSFNFSYYLSLELIFSSPVLASQLESLSLSYLNYPHVNLYAPVVNRDMINRSKVLFVLGLWENYLQKTNPNPQFISSNIFPICFDLVNNPSVQSHEVIEACHSVLLLCFNNKRKNLKDLMSYVNLIIGQFPRILSAQQLSIAVESLGKKILSEPVIYSNSIHADSADEFLEYLNFKCTNTTSGIPITIKPSENMFASAQPIGEIHAESTMKALDPQKESNIVKQNKLKKPKDKMGMNILPENDTSHYKFSLRVVPETSREAMVLSFINLIPYLPLSVFVKWLDKILLLVDSSNHNERIYLRGMLWKVISENLDLNRCEIAYRWWYETKKFVVHPRI